MDETEVLEVQEEQRKNAKRASLDLLKSKRRPQQEFSLKVNDEEYTFLFRAVSAKDWDYLVTHNKPNNEQKADNMAYNPDSFGPALLARVCIDPVMTEADWAEIWNSPEWSKGELSELFWTAVGLCNRGLDVNPTEPVSG